jgi:hypothetical protein
MDISTVFRISTRIGSFLYEITRIITEIELGNLTRFEQIFA